VHFAEKLKSYFLRLLTNKKITAFDIKNARNVLFLRYDRIGDMIITTPVFRELKQKYPEINIAVLASSINQNVLHNNPYVDKVYLNYKSNLLKDLPTLLKLRRNKYDVCVEFDHSVIPHAIIRLRIIKPKKVISVFKKGRYGVKGNELKLYDYYTEKPKGSHFQEIWLNTLSPFEVNSESNQYDLFCSDYQKKKAKDYLSLFEKKVLVGINIEGAVKGKRIQLNNLQEICYGIFNINNNVQIILLSSPKQRKKILQFCHNLKLSYVVPSYQTESILDAAALIEKLDLVISPDTSIVHLASAFNKPIISIHEDNKDSYQLFAPTSEISRTVFAETHEGINDFSVTQLLKYCDEIIKKIK
jgi:ADP-heptose:LPS heptosyltransferase